MLFFRFLCNFVSMIEKPPYIEGPKNGNPSKDGPILAEKLNSFNDDYLYWSDVKYKTSGTDLDSKELWRNIRESRLKRDIEVWHEYGFHFSLTNRMQRMCHEFDLNFGGSWGAMKLFPQDKLNQELYLISSLME